MEIKFLTDENIPASIVKALRNKRYSVFDIKEEGLFGISDKDLFQIASSSKRIIITYDKDYVNLAPYFLSSDSGVIVIKYSNKSPENVISNFIPLLETKLKEKLFGSLVEITDNFIKISKLKD